MSKRKITSLFLCLVLIMSLTMQAGAAAPTPKQLPANIADFGVPMSDEEMDEVTGTWGWIVLGAAGGALQGAISYSLSHADNGFSWKELGVATLTGAAFGAAGATVGTVAVLARGGSLAVKAAEVGWTMWGSANMGVFHGTFGAVQNELRK